MTYNQFETDVQTERARQRAKGWTPEHDNEHHPRVWTAILVRKVRELSTMETSAGRRRLLIQIAAVCAAAVETIDNEKDQK